MISENIIYFESGGRHNTDITLNLAKERALKRNIKNVIIASVTGFTAERALEIFKNTGIKLTIVSIKGPQFPGVPENLRRKIEQMGHNFCYVSDAKYEFPEVAQDTLRRFCEGMKVCVEITLVATEMGFIQPGEEVIAVGGTGVLGYEKGGGVDTAIIIEAMRSEDFLKLETIFGRKEERRKIKEIICKPR